MKRQKVALATALSMAFVSSIGAPAYGGPSKPTPSSSVTWNANGTHLVDGVATLNTEICGVANGAPRDGEYLVFVLSSTKDISSAQISFNTNSPISMDKSNTDKRGTSSYKKVYAGDLRSLTSAVATYVGLGTPTLTISHGCSGLTATGKALLFNNNFNCETYPDGSNKSICLSVGGNDSNVQEFFVDVLNVYGYVDGGSGIPSYSFDSVTNVSFRSADGTVKGAASFIDGTVGEGQILVVFTDNGYTADAGDYFVVTHNGTTYYFPIVY